MNSMTRFLEGLIKKIENRKVRIVFPEGDNKVIRQAAEVLDGIINTVLINGGDSLAKSAKMVANGQVDALVAGVDYTSRDVILAAREHIGTLGKTFSSSFVMELTDGTIYTLADCAACKNPTAEQLSEIILQTVSTHRAISDNPAKVALLSFSTFGSGGKDQSIDKIQAAIKLTKAAAPQLAVEGEMQLDAAVNPVVGQKKAPNSSVAGKANILIAPDLNSGNILYKSIEQFAKAHAYGPILQGFNASISDLSRGSTVEDVIGAAIISAARAIRRKA
jgi:phosphate acetyltransferase